MMTSSLCRTCGKPAEGHNFRHPFNDGSGNTPNVFAKKSNKAAQSPAGGPTAAPVQSSMPFDPVLRQALINKGLLTAQDLADAETYIRVLTGAMLSGLPDEHKEVRNDHA